MVGKSLWARKFARAVSKGLLKQGYVVHEFVSRNLESSLSHKQVLEVMTGADGNLIIGDLGPLLWEYHHVNALVKNGQMALHIPLSNEGKCVLVSSPRRSRNLTH